MLLVKRLDIFIAKQFGLLFAGTFFISQFVLMMQFLWRYVDELIGKGLSLDVLAQFFWYMGLMLVPQALPLAILLSSLITFGNLGESSELTAIKAAGISLMQAFRSLILLCIMIMLGSFYFQNAIAPEANKKLAQLLVAMKQKSPELEIPEGVFYDGIPNCNLYVQKKDMNSGMLYGVMIYRITNMYEDAAIILADSGRLQSTADKKHLLLTLYAGEWFENMKSQEMISNAAVPYRRETFIDKKILLDFDTELNVDDQVFAGDARGKGIDDIKDGINMTNHAIDSIGKTVYADVVRQFYAKYTVQKKDTADGIALAKKNAKSMNPDTLFAKMSSDDQKTAITQMLSEVKTSQEFLTFGSLMAEDGQRTLREHFLEWINKYSTALLCLVFFFIGAPLGAIIRKGGLGVPVIISVVVFIIYYILDNTGFRMARLGAWPVWLAKGMAPAVLIPTAIFFTYKANKDSTVFNKDMYRNAFRRLLGLRLKRNLPEKNVIFYDPDYAGDIMRLKQITEDVVAYNKEHRLLLAPNIIDVFFRYKPDHEIERISDELDDVIDDLMNNKFDLNKTDDKVNLNKMMEKYPIVSVRAHTRPFNKRWLNIAAFCIIPLGLFLYFRMWRFRLRLHADLRHIHSLNDALIAKLDTLLYNNNKSEQ